MCIMLLKESNDLVQLGATLCIVKRLEIGLKCLHTSSIGLA